MSNYGITRIFNVFRLFKNLCILFITIVQKEPDYHYC